MFYYPFFEWKNNHINFRLYNSMSYLCINSNYYTLFLLAYICVNKLSK